MYPAVGWLPLRILAAGAAFSPAMRPLVFLKPTGERSSGRGAPGSIANRKSARNRSLQLQTPRLRLFLDGVVFFLGYFYTFSDGLLGDVFKTEHHLTKTWIFRCHGDDFRMLSPNRKGYPSCQLFHVLNTLKPMGRRPNMFDKQLNIHDKPDKTKTIQHVFVVCPFVFWFEYFSQVDEHHPRLGQC